MIFCFPQYFTQRTRFLAYTVVAKALTLAGHVLTEHVDDCDAVLFSMCDVMEYPSLVRMKKVCWSQASDCWRFLCLPFLQRNPVLRRSMGGRMLRNGRMSDVE